MLQVLYIDRHSREKLTGFGSLSSIYILRCIKSPMPSCCILTLAAYSLSLIAVACALGTRCWIPWVVLMHYSHYPNLHIVHLLARKEKDDIQITLEC